MQIILSEQQLLFDGVFNVIWLVMNEQTNERKKTEYEEATEIKYYINICMLV